MSKPRDPKGADQRRRLQLLSALLLLSLLALAVLGALADRDPDTVALSKVVAAVKDGRVEKAEIFDGENRVEVTLTDAGADSAPGAGDGDAQTLLADYPFAYSDTLTELLLKADVPTETHPAESPSIFVSMLVGALPLILILGVLVWLVKSGVLGGHGKFSGKRGQQLGEVPAARFTDVAGCDEAVTELTELVEFLNSGHRFTAVGAKPPRGALLVGPPGTGKTLLARAVAGEAGVPFFALAGSDFVETFAGVGAKRVRDLFDRARQAGGAIIFIDEIDAVGRTRSAGPTHGGEQERENTLISMLNEMDGFDTEHRIIVLAATNRPDILDPALIRPGRLDRQVQVQAPDRRGREAVLRVHTRSRPLADDVDLTLVASRTPGMVGAELEQVVNEACMEAGRRARTQVDAACFSAAIETVALGRARTSALVTEQDRLITAWHEAGHTVAALVQDEADDPVSVSIVPRGPAGGVTWMAGSDDLFLTRTKALARLRVSMAGRAAEEVLLEGEFTQGAHGDLTAATNLAWAMVTKYGMSDLGYLVLDDDTIRMGGPVADRARLVAEELLADALADARDLLSGNAALLQAVAEALLEQENLTGEEVRQIAAQVDGGAEPGSPAAREVAVAAG